MRAVQITTLDGPEAVGVAEVEAPDSAGKVLIEVKAAGVAFPDVLQSRGQYQLRPELPFVPGSEVAGIVVEAPEDSEFAPGDRVAALSFLGGFAEHVAVDEQFVFPLPEAVSFEKGASVIFNYGTAYFALIERGHLQPGETVLVHGAAGGVGTAAIQVAKAFGSGSVVAVVSTPEKGDVAITAGADSYVLADGFREALTEKFDLVVDPVGGDRFTDSLRSLAEDGRLLVIGFTGGSIPEVKVNRLLLNNTTVVGVGWGAYALSRQGHVRMEWDALLPHLVSGALDPVISSTRPLEGVVDALLEIDQRRATGKVLLVP
ncbi:NADPH:quinone oxidoreductase family protein [Aeromicrobium alkaliterrae]|uniref:NADPH:quinone oxidoreductase family protein n=1 Tax=Aeromicrobium alkaliterrae TaxID=302168 RepID=A0ABN2JWS2_9ACTN